MPNVNNCENCGALLTNDARDGVCPKCLFAQARQFDELAIEDDATSNLPRPFGEYELIEEVARGGMGIVYKARQPSLDRIVAIKMLLFGPLASPDFVKRFRAEASAAAALSHPNIVGIHEVGVIQGQHYFAMEYVQGESLSKMLVNGPFPARHAARYMSVIAEAIQYAHQRGILHRDLKPSNVLIDTHDQPRVTDFGLARRLEGDSQLTLTGQVLGSPNYMPPEQATARRGELDRRSDVYSLGAMLYHLLTGRPPFGAEAITETLDQVLNAQPVSPRLLQPSVPRDLETICLKCLEKQPDKRYATAHELAEELNRFLQGEPIQARPVSAPERFWRWCQRKPATAASLATIALLLLIVLIGSPIALIRINRERKQAAHLLYFSNINGAQTAWEQNNVGLMRQLLDELRSSPDRGFEWFYWQRQVHRASMTLRGHSNLVIWVAVSPDGRQLVSASTDHTVKLWDTASGGEPRVLRTFTGHSGEVYAVAFSFDGKWVASGSEDNTVRIWETATGRESRKLVGPTRGIGMVGFSPDGRRVLAGGADNTVFVWDRESGEVCFKVAGNPCTFSPNGQRILTGVNRRAVLWDATDGHELIQCKDSHTADIVCVAFSPDGNRFATGGQDLTARVWDATNGQRLFTLDLHGSAINCVAFSANGQRIATASYDQTARVWDATNGQPLFPLKGHAGHVEGVAFFPDGRIVTCGDDATIRIWEADGPRDTLEFGRQDPRVWTWGIAFSADGKRIVSGFSNSQGKVWDANTGEILYKIPAVSVAFSPDGRRFVTDLIENTGANAKRYAEVFEAESCQSLFRFPVHKELVLNLAFSPDGQRIATASQDKTARVWDVGSGKELHTLVGHSNEVRGIAFSPDGTRILTASHDRTARIWDSASGAELAQFTEHRFPVFSCAFSPDGQWVVTGDENGTVLLWEGATRRVIHTLTGHNTTMHSLVFSPDGKRILSGSDDGTARLWDSASGREMLVLKGHKGAIYHAVFSRDGQRIATARQGGLIEIWESATPEQVAAWRSEERK